MEKNINNDFDDSLYNELLLKESILIPPENFNNKINYYIEQSLKSKIEEKCISDGYVKKDTVNIIKKSTGNLKGSQFNGYINYELIYKAMVCNPKNGSIIKCKVKLINNKLGLLGNNGPLVIIVGKQLHNKPELLDEININDIIDIKVIESKFCLNDKEIRILGKLNIDADNVSKKNIDIDDLNDIDSVDIDDVENLSNKNIDNIDLESLDNISSADELDDDLDDDIDELDDQQDEDDMDDIEEAEDVEDIGDIEDVEDMEDMEDIEDIEDTENNDDDAIEDDYS